MFIILTKRSQKMRKLLLVTLFLFQLGSTVKSQNYYSVHAHQWVTVPVNDPTFQKVWSELLDHRHIPLEYIVSILRVRFDPDSHYPMTNYWIKALLRDGQVHLGEITIFRQMVKGDFNQEINCYHKPELLNPSF